MQTKHLPFLDIPLGKGPPLFGFHVEFAEYPTSMVNHPGASCHIYGCDFPPVSCRPRGQRNPSRFHRNEMPMAGNEQNRLAPQKPNGLRGQKGTARSTFRANVRARRSTCMHRVFDVPGGRAIQFGGNRPCFSVTYELKPSASLTSMHALCCWQVSSARMNPYPQTVPPEILAHMCDGGPWPESSHVLCILTTKCKQKNKRRVSQGAWLANDEKRDPIHDAKQT